MSYCIITVNYIECIPVVEVLPVGTEVPISVPFLEEIEGISLRLPEPPGVGIDATKYQSMYILALNNYWNRMPQYYRDCCAYK